MKYFLTFLFSVAFLISCTHDKYDSVVQAGYPKEVGAIIVNKCATAGCHNSMSATNANGLDFSTWDSMFKGGKNGSAVIPYSVDYSYMLYFINTDKTLGLALQPTMPYNQAPLSKSEYLIIENWIANGAPNSDGIVKFSDNPSRKKFYVCMQGCDQVAVFDAETRVIMRYVSVGIDPVGIEAPHDVTITPDGKYWALAFYAGRIVQFFNTTDDKLVATVNIGAGTWNIITFTPDSRKAYISSFAGPEVIAEVDIPTFTHTLTLTGIDAPHGLIVNQDGSILYVTSQYGNHINKIHLSDYSIDQVILDGSGLVSSVSSSSSLDPHQIQFTPDESEYFVSCQRSNEIRIVKTTNDSVIKVLKVGVKPQEMEVSDKYPYMFVTCMEDSVTFSPSQKGSVYVINYKTNNFVKAIYPGYQPHGIDVDEDQNLAYITNLNYGGPAPHHITNCGGKNGYVTIIDLNSFNLLSVKLPDGSTYQYKNEVLPFPYEVAYRK